MTTSAVKPPDVDDSTTAIVENWDVVVSELAEKYHVDLFDPVVRARPWLGIRAMIFALIATPGTRLRQALTRR